MNAQQNPKLEPEIAGAIARFWAGGSGPSHSSLNTAFALAGFEDPNESKTKQDRVLFALRQAPVEVGRRIVEELLSILRNTGRFEREWADSVVDGARAVFERCGHDLDDQGFVIWSSTAGSRALPDSSPATGEEPPPDEVSVFEVSVPSVPLLVDSLRRLPVALRPLLTRRRSRPGIEMNDEYDLQDAVEALLRTLYNDVRPEERTPGSAGSGSVMDFLLRDDAVAIEVKVTKPGRNEKHIKPEILVDINDYEAHPNVKTLIVAVYDLSSTFQNAAGFEKDLSRTHGDLEVIVVVIGWPVPPNRTALVSDAQ